MFLCSRQIDINTRFGLPRIFFIAVVTTIITFLISYEVLIFLSNKEITDRYFFVFLIAVLLLYPIHKLIHLIVLAPYYKHFKKKRLTKRPWIPLYNLYVSTPVNKYLFCLCLIAPVIVITAVSIYMATLMPQYGHYFMFLLSLNAGFSVMDFMYLKLILFSNEGRYIEEHCTGFNILNKYDMPLDTNFN
ncbi:DUF3267 domain-containing protein [Staphylococcus simulans]|uniref:DUF3267 domain-containing protein n=1 Tax=Staphylococcus simulans TaxID=1286 RepID=UPI000D1DF55B|nr:DUF3267 domain-containing protein [Staphylococcus simulans]MDY5061238.1 DUF3267 domain-containing protein [Staphylococcus simulans]PTJ15083.1 DUF3267 domain-containing protein [Staphylococcus simulans]RIN77659.1 DUF3267 domain-containing protein [Staphylococcus simulans]